MRAVRAIIAGAAILTVAACGGSDARLYNLRSDSGGPDEFAILPTKPIEMPEDLAALPLPTPGGTNRVDPTPEADAFAALGGNAEVLSRGVTDPGLVRYASRYGTDPAIRQQLATADAEFRRTQGPRVWNVWPGSASTTAPTSPSRSTSRPNSRGSAGRGSARPPPRRQASRSNGPAGGRSRLRGAA
jgi:hypothetical protein